MATIQDLHDLVSNNETQQGGSDRITGAEVRAVDNNIIDELARRGSIQLVDNGGLPTLARTESQNASIPLEGLFVSYETDDPVDNVVTFASPDAGWVWRKVANYTSPAIIRSAINAAQGLTYDATTGTMIIGMASQTPGPDPSILTTDRFINCGDKVFGLFNLNGNSFRFNQIGSDTPLIGINLIGPNTNRQSFMTMNMVQQLLSGGLRNNIGATIISSYNTNGPMQLQGSENFCPALFAKMEWYGNATYPGGVITMGDGASQLITALTAQIGFTTAGFSGSTVGLLAAFSTKLKLSAGAMTVDKFYHVFVNDRGTPAANNNVNEHYGVFIAPLKTTPTTKSWGIVQLYLEDNNYFAGKILITPTTFNVATIPTANVDIDAGVNNGATQLRTRQPFTPTGSADAAGNIGSIAWDDSNMYVKTSTGWKRAAIAAF